MNISNYLHEKLKWSICGAIILVPTLAISEVKPVSVNTAKWQPQSSERLVKLPPSYLKKSLDRDFAGSGLGQALKSTQTDIQNKGNTLSDLQKSIETAEGELKLELRHQFLAEKRAFLDLMANQIDLNKRRANTRLNLFQKMLDELRNQNAANTPTKKELIERQNLARTRMQSSLSKVDLKIFESATVPESQYAVKYGQNVQAIERLMRRIKDHQMNQSLTADGTEMTKKEFIRHMAIEAEAELALAEQDDLILGYMAKLVALDAMALSEEAIDAEQADSALPTNSSPHNAVTFFLKN